MTGLEPASEAVCFTWADILGIGALLPELMSHRLAGPGITAVDQSRIAAAADAALPSDVELDRWVRLASAR